MENVQNENTDWFGNPHILKRFSEENDDLIRNTLPYLKSSFDLIQKEVATISPLNKQQMTLITLAHIVYEDFFEILLLCGFGKRNGAKKVLRGMFERTVTLSYLKDNSNEVETFWRYGDIAEFKRAKIQKEQGKITDGDFERIEQQYKQTKSQFEINACDKCKTKKLNHSWTKMNLVDMSKKTDLYSLIDPLYYDPMQETHVSVAACRSRFVTGERDGKYFASYIIEPNWQELIVITEQANLLFLRSLIALQEYFNFSEEVKKSLLAYKDSNLQRLQQYKQDSST